MTFLDHLRSKPIHRQLNLFAPPKKQSLVQPSLALTIIASHSLYFYSDFFNQFPTEQPDGILKIPSASNTLKVSNCLHMFSKAWVITPCLSPLFSLVPLF